MAGLCFLGARSRTHQAIQKLTFGFDDQVVIRDEALKQRHASSRIWNETWLSAFFHKPCNHELFVLQSLNMEGALPVQHLESCPTISSCTSCSATTMQSAQDPQIIPLTHLPRQVHSPGMCSPELRASIMQDALSSDNKVQMWVSSAKSRMCMSEAGTAGLPVSKLCTARQTCFSLHAQHFMSLENMYLLGQCGV